MNRNDKLINTKTQISNQADIKEHPNVLHLLTERTWRGGENQVRLLLKGGLKDASWHIVCPPNSEAAKRLTGLASMLLLDTRSFIEMPRAIWILHHYCRKHDIQIIDCHSSKAHSLGLILKRLNPHLKLVIHRRVDYPPKADFRSRVKYHSNYIDQYITISHAIAAILMKAGVPSNKITTVRSAVDPEPFLREDKVKAKKAIAEELRLKKHVPLILNVAYHTDQKGMPTLIQALSILKKQNKDFICLLAGYGHLTEELKQNSKQLDLECNIHFLGIRNDIPKLLAAADIFAFPSNKEGLGTSLLDAGLSRCAVAATNVGGIPEIIQHEVTGLLSEVGDAPSHAANLKRLIDNEDLRQNLSEALQRHVLKEFSWEKMVQGNLSVYSDLLGGQT